MKDDEHYIPVFPLPHVLKKKKWTMSSEKAPPKKVQNGKKLQKPHFTPCLVIRQIFGKKRVAELCYFSVAVMFRNQPEDDESEE